MQVPTTFWKCPGCGHIHFGITEEAAVAEVQRFNDYVQRLSPEEWQSGYGGRTASVENYRKCRTCGTPTAVFVRAIGYENSGLTMQPVVVPDAS